jgi:hypothetical protein
MDEPVPYSVEHANSIVELTLTAERFIVKTQGKGLLDKPKTIDIPPSDVDKFCVVPTIVAQNVVGAGPGRQRVYDGTYDAEFIFSYRDAGKLNKKRVFVDSEDETFQHLLAALKTARPTASLLDLDPAEAQKQIGALSASKALYLMLGVIVGVPLVIGIIVLLTKHGS